METQSEKNGRKSNCKMVLPIGKYHQLLKVIEKQNPGK
jgi:hypothetical protein